MHVVYVKVQHQQIKFHIKMVNNNKNKNNNKHKMQMKKMKKQKKEKNKIMKNYQKN